MSLSDVLWNLPVAIAYQLQLHQYQRDGAELTIDVRDEIRRRL